MTATPDADFQQRMQRVEGLLHEIEALPDARARESAREVVRALMDLHGAGLAAMLDLIGAAGQPGRELLDAFARDGLIASLLLLYGLHPVDLAARVRAALDTLRPMLREQGGDIELVDLDGGTARLRLTGDGLEGAVREAIFAAAPDLVAVEIEVAADGDSPARLISLPLVGR